MFSHMLLMYIPHSHDCKYSLELIFTCLLYVNIYLHVYMYIVFKKKKNQNSFQNAKYSISSQKDNV